MLTFLRRMMRRDNPCPPRSAPQTTATCRCHESEFCFFNHSATFAFDQVNECELSAPQRKEKTESEQRR
ncbi:hypothetical protein HC231_13355 [Brenneria izadpanahii]|uniref:Uncharacterized protein n=1 Tax=Brenneria izadpanahii TaxID=2722756 RepID=A0ABX7UYY8_9GAMM|nr:hypothetical protein [Brenneria izadpanahii]QTF08779.1 hypothetical protein HC231_13355 [Brenneria izadpanahii]